MSPRACGPGRRIGNRVKNPDGTAAVSAEAAPVDESRSLGNREDRAPAVGDFSPGASQKTCLKMALPPASGRQGRHSGAGIRPPQSIGIVAAVFGVLATAVTFVGVECRRVLPIYNYIANRFLRLDAPPAYAEGIKKHWPIQMREPMQGNPEPLFRGKLAMAQRELQA